MIVNKIKSLFYKDSDKETEPLLAASPAARLNYSTVQNENSNHPIGASVAPPEHYDCKLSQHAAALTATLGVLATGTAMGWSAPVLFKITKANSTDYDFDVSSSQSAWISSIFTLGAAFACFPCGLIMDRIGRKPALLLLVLPFTLGWLLITFGTTVEMLIAGRFITGIAAGAICVTVPAYTSEIAQDSIRGNLGTYFQLMISFGLLYAFTIGSYTSVFVFNILCTLVPIIFGIIFFFMPESPIYLLEKNRNDEAKKALIWLRSSGHGVDYELNNLKSKTEEDKAKRTSYLAALTKKAAIKALLFCCCLIFFQQLSGINAITFNEIQIFYDAGATISPELATITIGVIQVIFAYISALVVDVLGRRILLIFSTLTMCCCHICLGIYFFLQQTFGNDASVVQTIRWLPLISLCVFIIAFTIGVGPVPWIMIGELCSIEVRSFVSAASGTLNWLLAFVVTSSFNSLSAAIGTSQVYWLFAGFMLLGFVFVFFFIPETKGKSIEEIQIMLGDVPENCEPCTTCRFLTPDADTPLPHVNLITPHVL